jgi:uncharacterized RDD family membrane protein YckC
VEYDDVLTIATPEGVEMRLTLAGPASRFVSAIVDIVIQIVLLFCVSIVLSIAGHGFGVGSGVAVLLWAVLSFAVITFYDVFFEVFQSGRTPGKRLNGLRVVRASGHPVTFLTSAVRNILRPIDFLPSAYLLGAIVILVNRKNQRIGDMIADTLVVRERVDAGRQVSFDAPLPSAPVTAGAWDTSRVSPEEIAAVRQFLERRSEIELGSRNEIARTLAERLRPKVTGAPADLRGEQFLAALLAAKSGRAS